MRYERPQLIDFRSHDVSGDPQACFNFGGIATSQCQIGGTATSGCWAGNDASGDCSVGSTAVGSL